MGHASLRQAGVTVMRTKPIGAEAPPGRSTPTRPTPGFPGSILGLGVRHLIRAQVTTRHEPSAAPFGTPSAWMWSCVRR